MKTVSEAIQVESLLKEHGYHLVREGGGGGFYELIVLLHGDLKACFVRYNQRDNWRSRDGKEILIKNVLTRVNP